MKQDPTSRKIHENLQQSVEDLLEVIVALTEKLHRYEVYTADMQVLADSWKKVADEWKKRAEEKP